MAAAMAYCTSNTVFQQYSLSPSRSPFSPTSRRLTSSPSTSFSSTIPTSHIERSPTTKTIKSDENNNERQIEDTIIPNIDEILYITSDDDEDDDIDDGDQIIFNDLNQEEFLSLIGLRSKVKKPIVAGTILLPLTKRFACPVCLLPLPKYSERVRQALYIRLPFLKFLSITSDIERFCSTDESARAQSLLPRSAAQARALSSANKSPRNQKLSKTGLISIVANTVRNSTSKTTTSKHRQSILQCNVVLDRLEQSTIDQIMQNAIENDEKPILTRSIADRSSSKTSSRIRRSVTISKSQTTRTQTSLTTTTTEKTVVKRKSITVDIDKPKRFKSVENDCTVINDNGTKNELPSLTHQRIYLKCFVCSKRQYVDAPATDSDVLHSHWLEHDGDLSLNIYDSEIDSILTRIVEFFNLPRQHLLEGKIKTVFIFNSKEIRSTSTTTLSSNDSYIVID